MQRNGPFTQRPTWRQFQLGTAWLLVLNGLLGLLVPPVVTLVRGGAVDAAQVLAVWPGVSIAVGLMALRGLLVGWLGGLVVCTLQSVSVFSSGFNFSVQAGVSWAAVFQLTHGVLLVNWVGVALALACGAVLAGWCKD